MARPDQNITGVNVDSRVELNGKRLQLLRDTVGRVTKVRLLVPATNLRIWEQALPAVREVADKVSIELAVLSANIDQQAYEQAFERLTKEQADGLIVTDGAENITYRQLIADLAARHRLPAIYCYREATEVGGLMSYGVDLADVLTHLAGMTDQVLRGVKPSEIPFYQQTRYELVLNRKAAIGIRVEFPPSLLVSADEVID